MTANASGSAAGTPSVNVRWAADSSTGLVRKDNQDSAYAGSWLYAVADGLGGHPAGDVASASAIEALRPFDIEVATGDLLGTLAQVIGRANAALASRIAADPAVAGMGTTLTALLRSGNSAVLANIGDSRAYLMRDGSLRRISEDHTMGKLVDGPDRLAPVMVRHLNGRPEQSPDLTLHVLRPGDRYLLCSDGLSGFVGREHLQGTLRMAPDAGEAARRLSALAYDAGAPDNVTVIVLDITGAAVEAQAPVTLGSAAEVVPARTHRARAQQRTHPDAADG
jgi:PPM family protein phosphatase